MKNQKKTLNLTSRSPNGDVKEFEKHLNKILRKNDILKKEAMMIGDFNMNLLDFQQQKKVQNFVNILTHTRYQEYCNSHRLYFHQLCYHN